MKRKKRGDLHLVYYLRDESINTRGDEWERRERRKREGERATEK